MELTRQQEEQLLEKYDKLLWKIVHDFKKTACSQNNTEDLHSECVLVFIQHIRSCQSEEEIGKMPFRAMRNAMCRLVLGEQLLSYPQRTTSFSKITKHAPERIDYETLGSAVLSVCRIQPWNNVISRIAFKDFCKELPEDDLAYIRLKLAGYKNHEIAKKLGVNDAKVTRTLQRLRKAYQEQTS